MDLPFLYKVSVDGLIPYIPTGLDHIKSVCTEYLHSNARLDFVVWTWILPSLQHLRVKYLLSAIFPGVALTVRNVCRGRPVLPSTKYCTLSFATTEISVVFREEIQVEEAFKASDKIVLAKIICASGRPECDCVIIIFSPRATLISPHLCSRMHSQLLRTFPRSANTDILGFSTPGHMRLES